MRNLTLTHTGLLVWLTLATVATSVAAERWMCPSCDEMVDRAAGADLECHACDGFFTEDDLTWYVAHINYRTRDAELSFLILPEDCGIFRMDGLQALDGEGPYWVPWAKVDFFIPRMRLIHLLDGRDLATDYPKGPTCPKPPEFVFEISDEIIRNDEATRMATREVESDMAALFVVAGNEEARDRGVLRFIEEVEAGLHPRLPRTAARATRPLPPVIPNGVPVGELADKKVVVEVRISDSREVQVIRLLESSGFAALDNAASIRARGSGLLGGGELGVPVPGTVLFNYTFKDGKPAVDVVVPENSIWGDRATRTETEDK